MRLYSGVVGLLSAIFMAVRAWGDSCQGVPGRCWSTTRWRPIGGQSLALVALALQLFALPAQAGPCAEGDTAPRDCSVGVCKGVAYCEGPYLGECTATGESTQSCTVCGRTGYRYCSDFDLMPESCSAHRAELCNACDDDGDGAVDEGLAGAACTLPNGCSGVMSCSSSGGTCVWAPGSTKPCPNCGTGGYATCQQDGSIGLCRPVAPTGEIDCNGCDDNHDGVADGASSTAETCNGQDDDCDGAIDEGSSGVEGDACAVNVAQVCCEPTTCVAQGKNCGVISNGCGSPLDCGTCPSGQACGTGGVPNVCACAPIPEQTACSGKCGLVPNGCGSTWNCGGCTSPQSCGGGGTPNVCGCTPVSQATACAGKNCGLVSNGCGGTYSCGGACTGYNSCGGGGNPNVCGCSADPNACDGRECGSVDNGCGGTMNCGTCLGTAYCRAGECVGGDLQKSEEVSR
ncbi:hypothetical protein SAMN05443572_112142 [Myxococcus fulvus]|uniref:Lipoprotein n=1 Tax=Myxococcus fulvus TaxID=33 RepID=A0ABY1CTI5_MYXFU|nr:hypothetical protein SAMN05443572_112142 [Myxococcus fulvus]